MVSVAPSRKASYTILPAPVKSHRNAFVMSTASFGEPVTPLTVPLNPKDALTEVLSGTRLLRWRDFQLRDPFDRARGLVAVLLRGVLFVGSKQYQRAARAFDPERPELHFFRLLPALRSAIATA